MPKVLVLLVDVDHDAAHVAAAAVDGATSVRFTEVDLCSTTSCEPIAGRRCRPLESVDHVLEYDGLVLVAEDAQSAGLASFVQSVEALDSHGPLANVVMGITTGRRASSIDQLARLGGIIVVAPSGASDPASAARHIGSRVAEVGAWVRHSLDHEQHHHHVDGHRHEHHDHHHHARGTT